MAATEQDMVGRVCMITGASQGIGLAAAKAIARKGPTMVLVGRDAERTEKAAAEVRDESGNKDVSVMIADLSSQAAIRKLAEDFKASHERLHLLVNNAGAVHTSRKLTKDGLEATFATNHLGYFLLTTLLLDLLKASAPARVVSVSSEAHRQGHIDFNDLQSEKGYASFKVYGTSKLANILFTTELARRLQGTGVTANCLHPGVVSTGFGKNDKGLLAFAAKLASPFLLTAEKGALTTIYLATSPEVAGVSGKYFAKCREKTPTREAQDTELARKLWDVSEKLTSIAAAPAV